MEGWIKIHRKILEWEWYDDNNVFRLFFHLLMTANYEEKSWHGITIGRGQIVTSVDNLSSQLGLSAQQIRTAINKLKITQEITSKTTNKFTLITICNYEKYQFTDNAEQQTKQQTNNNQITNEQQTNNNNIRNKEYKNIRNKERYSVSAEKSAPQPKPTKTLEERRNDFMYKIAEIGKGVYPDQMLRAFFDYWSESNENGKKMLFEMKKTFDTKKRLATWASRENDKQFNSKGYGDSRNNPNSPDYVSTERIVAAGFAMAKAGI